MKAPLALFRADAGTRLGTGHIMRGLTLADELAKRGWGCRFVVNEPALSLIPGLGGRDVVTAMPDTPGADLLVVDHYGLDQDFERSARAVARKVLVIDDLADRRHCCDWLLDQNQGRVASDYAGLVDDGTTLLLGPHFALLRPDFLAARSKSLARLRYPVRRILVTLGGTDPDNVSALVLAALAQAKMTAHVSVVMGASAPHLDEVKAVAARQPYEAEVLVGVSDMAALMASCDLCIGAGGVTSWERCCLGLPTIALVIADNQKDVVAGLVAAGAAWAAPLDCGGLADRVRALCDDGPALAGLASRAASLCDGQGAVRVADHLDASLIDLRPATWEDAQALLDWRNDPLTQANSRSADAVLASDHHAWLGRVLAASDRVLWIGERAGLPIGMVRFDGHDGHQWEVAINVAPAARRQGTGRRLLMAAIIAFCRAQPRARLRAEIHQDNHASQRIFAQCGFHIDGRRDEWLLLGLRDFRDQPRV